MVVRVASSTGQNVCAVSTASFALTLWAFLQIEEADRFHRIEAEHDRLDAAGLTAMAYHEPHKLQQRQSRLLSAMGAVPSREEAFRRAAELDRRDRELKAANPLPPVTH